MLAEGGIACAGMMLMVIGLPRLPKEPAQQAEQQRCSGRRFSRKIEGDGARSR
ncbi:hypothetical protein [Microcoleus vaginatus]|uniref:hypothetical protein n=1 Tax=Microcoleus vaginatus TaxID=119532 RepID=UPI0032A72F40